MAKKYDEISAGAVVFYPGERVGYLLLHYPAGHWDFPKGNVELGETPEQAALREIKEETGLDAELLPGFKVEVEYVYTRGGRRVLKKVIYFLAQAKSRDVKLSWEHVGYAWLPFEQAMARATYKSTKEVLAKAHKKLMEIYSRR
ncbi:diadenosine 5'5'''-P1,P4-tetraphosphate pyrophosphohydrolase (mutT/nudix family protein) [Pyrobaculum aerophilum str. IM2]|uniref:Bis(5'-nucleosyl)-tetraphosphatase [asymmetrical] n=2 Tax=Pyrobaculum aerophilum TaxID=13773 RepID=Q7LX33_PYRAE|nr:bis(5'-nucleosyl)-tetraphosphatase [Pyrobaculum aerophilum]AAD00530.1 diadenosine 5'5'''-P1,P4-tetraphosphate pyrophosphohydrolase [Pyrobaculum aerophilum str. IM2]AAL62659.1 diadenosine 5'5'''-P1,P4-tetraphosphate pyrophosphohydrolase (mutT/nudix family protein) [Pyrobaculum aerophilum str. IM2]HII46712.1 NUDIX domain-containing protein [Pyrobaculum aerophilum]